MCVLGKGAPLEFPSGNAAAGNSLPWMSQTCLALLGPVNSAPEAPALQAAPRQATCGSQTARALTLSSLPLVWLHGAPSSLPCTVLTSEVRAVMTS